jgi:hypothetical protein
MEEVTNILLGCLIPNRTNECKISHSSQSFSHSRSQLSWVSPCQCPEAAVGLGAGLGFETFGLVLGISVW